MKITLALIISLYTASSFAASFSVTKLNDKGTRTLVANPGTLMVGDTLTFTDEFSETCNAKVIKVNKDTAALDTSHCDNIKAIKVGVMFEKGTSYATPPGGQNPYAPPPAYAKEQAYANKTTPTIDESWYTLWGFGFSNVDYGDDAINDSFDFAESQSGITRTKINMDILGFYWPVNDNQTMHGFIVNTVADSLDGPGGTISIYQYLYAYSYHHFFGANIGDGWFFRADAGLTRSLLIVETTGLSGTDSSKTGIGLLGGGGYAFAMGQETRFLLGLYATSRKVEDDRALSFNLTAGFLF
ncbi:MAG: hypothetical protein KDD38_06415 [Bdellovibrionales bacterium]|nr:hypothetical protein [Bdellovibrionales bacterium]